jgi:fibronectin-binding autotransporter adhesin
MQTTPRTSFRPVSVRRALHRVCVGSIALFAGMASGQNVITKANNETDLSLSGSWVGDVVPGPTDIALWDATVAGPNSVVLGADLSWHGLQLSNPGGAVTIGAGNTLTLGVGGIDLSLATQDLMLQNAVTLGAAQSWNAGGGRTLTVTGSIGDGGAFLGLTKIGAGTLVLAGSNTYAGPTAVNGGTLLLNFAAGGAADANIVNPNSLLQFGGGTLTMQGAAAETNTQDFFSTTFNAGLNTVNVAAGAGGQTTLALGTVTTTIDSVVRFTNTGTITATGVVTGANGILGANGAAAINVASAGYATVGLDDFAALSNGAIVGGSTIAAFYQTTYANNFDMTANTVLANGGAQRAAAVVRFNTPTATTLTGGTGNLITFGAALITPNMGANNTSLTGAGSWQIIRQTGPNGPQQGTIWQNNPLGFYSVTIPITDGREGTADPSRIVKAGAGTVVFSGANSYTGQTSVYEGALMITADNNLGGASAPVALRGGTLFGNSTFTTSATRGFTLAEVGGLATSTGNTMTVSGAITGTGALAIGSSMLTGTGPGTANPTPVVGNGKVALAADNSYSGGTTVSFGTVAVPGINALGSLNYGGVTLMDGGTLQYASTLTSDSDLTVGKGITLGSGGGGIDTNGNAITFANGLRGPGGLIKSGAGTLTLTAAGTYQGGTTISGGILQVAAPSGSATGSGAIIVNSGGTLSGSGTIGGTVTINAGGILDPGIGVGTLVLPGLTLGADSLLKFEFNSTPANDFIQVTGMNGLTIDGGNVNVLIEGSGSPFATAGTYNLFSFNGAIQGVGTGAFSVLNPAAGFLYTFGTNNSFITLTVATSGLVTTWANAAGGSWGTASNWNNGVPNEIGATAIFGTALTAPGTIALNGSKTVGNMTFDSANSYTIASGTGGSITFETNTGAANLMVPQGNHTISAPVVLGSNLIADVGANGAVTLTGAISGARTLTKRGSGVLSLTSANTYTGDTTVEGGTLGVGHSSALGTGAVIVPNSVTVRADGSGLTIANNVVIGSGVTATFDTQANNVTLSGVISDAATNGILRKTGAGALSLTGANTYTGGTVVGAGTLIVNSMAALGTGAVTFAGDAMLQQTSALVLGNNVNVAAGVTGWIDTNGNDMVLNGNIAGAAGSLTKIGVGVLTLNGTNSFGTTGGAMLNANEGTVVFGTAGAVPMGIGLQTAGGIIDLNSFPATASALSGASGVVTDNSNFGGTTTLTVDQAGNTAFSGSINNGPVQILALTKAGAGTLALGGINTYSGATNANGGILQLDAGGFVSTSALTIANNGTFRVNGGDVTVNGATNLNNAGGAAMTVVSGNATLNGALTTGNSANRYFINVQGGTLVAQSFALGRTGLNFSAEPAAGATTDGLYIQDGSVVISGALAMGAVAAANSSVSTRIDGGILTVGGPIAIGLNNTGRWSILDVNGGALTSTDATSGILIGGPFGGSAVFLTRAGTATVERIELSSLAGATSVLNAVGGSLYIGSGGIVQGTASAGLNTVRLGSALIGAKDSWTSSLPISLNGTTIFHAEDAVNTPHDITLGGTLADFGALVKTGGGNLILSGANSYFGSTTINAGVLRVTALSNGGQPSGIGASSGDAFNLILNGGTLRYTGPATNTDRSFTVGSAGATLDASGSGSLKFTNSNALQFAELDVPHPITLTGTNAGDNTISAVIADSGAGVTSLIKSGPGTWVLTGPNLYTGTTTIEGGTLRVANETGSATGTGSVLVNAGATLGGAGMIIGPVGINSGGHLAPGAGVGTLTVGNLTLSANSILDFEFNGTPLNDLVIISGTNGLTINGGAFNLFAEGSTSRWTTPGTYNLLQYGGALAGSANSLSVLNPQNGLAYTFGTSGGFVTLTIDTTVTFSNWTSPTGGSWNTVGNWSSGIPNGLDAAANFLGALTAPGTVTLDGAKTLGTLQFNNSSSYTITSGTGGTLTLNVSTGSAQITNLNGSHTVTAPVILASNTAVDVTNVADTLNLVGSVSGQGSLTKNGAGLLRLSSANSYSGGSTLSGGTLEIAHDEALGTGTLAVNGTATLRAGAADLVTTNPINIGANAALIVDAATNVLRLSGAIGSTNATGGLVKAGPGTLALGDSNTYTGPTTINEGALAVSTLADGGSPSGIGQSTNAAANLVIDGGALRYLGAGANTDRLFTIGANGATLDASGTGPVNLTNPGALEFPGAAQTPLLTLTGSNTGANTLTAAIGNNGVFATSLNKTGPGTWLLAGTNTFTGETAISEGLLALGNPLALQRSTLNYNNQGGVLGFDVLDRATLGGLSGSQNLELANAFAGAVALTVGANNANTTYEGVLSGFGSLIKTGTGVLNLSGKSTFSGPATISGGVLRVLTTDALSPTTAITVNNPGGLQLSDGVILNSSITAAVGANEFLNIPDASATAVVGGNLSVAGGGNQFRLGIAGAGATLNVTGGINIPNAGSIVFLTRGNIVFAGDATINSVPGITFGRSAQALDVSFRENTVANISGGGDFGGGQANPSITMTIQDNASVSFGGGLDLNASSAATNQTTLNLNGGSLTAAAIFKNSLGSTQLTAVNFNGGVLRAGSSSTTFLPAWNGLTANVQSGGAKIDTNGFDITIAQPLVRDPIVSTDGGLTKSGIGTLNLAGNNQYNGPTQVTAGFLVVSGTLTGTTAIEVIDSSIVLGGSNRIDDAAMLVLGPGGGLQTGGFSEVLGSLNVVGDAFIDLGAGESILHLANSASNLWAPGTLTIVGWSGALVGQGSDEIYFGADATGLTTAQVSQIRFLDPIGLAPGFYEAKLLTTGELVAVPEPGSVTLLVAAVGGLVVCRRRRT